MGRRGGADFFIRLLFLVRSLVRPAVCGAGVLSAVRSGVLPGTCRLCAAALCCTGRLRAGPRTSLLAAILSNPGMLSIIVL